MSDKRKILIDCDTGTDDAIAIVAGLYSGADVVAFTTVNGNVAVKYTSRNTLDLVRFLGFDTPVAVGAYAPLKPRIGHLSDGTHGATGLGDLSLPYSEDAFYTKNAVETIYDEAVKAKGALEIVAVGPLTNLAITLLMYPEIKSLIKHLWIMGGAVRGGNVNETAEFNIWVDPEAARLVFASGIECSMIGLDVTEKAILNEDDAAAMRELGTNAGIFVADMLDFMFRRRDAGGEDAMMHDALALAAAFYPECLKFGRFYVDVECEGIYTFGHTMVDIHHRLDHAPNADVALELDLPAFKNWLYGCVKGSAKR